MKALDSFTVERLEEWINTPEKYNHRYSPRINCDELRVLARIALAAKRAEPVTPVEYAKQVNELVMWIKRLAHSLSHAKPESKLPDEAKEYLVREGLVSVEDALR
ncbi:hypothetical protein ACSMDC_02205 [Yersinia enterocolitica]|uniref:hypothetical protein n=1 Tax=Yersinia enterocolitica TaxID=630 RepID=UPI003F524006